MTISMITDTIQPSQQAIVMIPSRMGSVRLPNKPMALIHGEPMIVHVWRNACAAQIGKVVVACDHPDIAAAITAVGGSAVITQRMHATGSDRLAEAIDLVDPEQRYTIVVNVQGDLPLFPATVLGSILTPFQMDEVDMTTFIQPHDPKSVGAVRVQVQSMLKEGEGAWLRCENFTRQDWESEYSHLGVYAFRRSVLKNFSQWPQTARERAESLEQLRVLDRGVTIAGVLLGSEVFLSVDTLADLEKVRAHIKP